ncbi:uncharacterized protein JCM15063_004442 [Sporobolomyces koalae]|uniref:uncharacterized protein n=1 Tax=Sporobolomyces koalae TaxID=500713 RepID=UPI003171546D
MRKRIVFPTLVPPRVEARPRIVSSSEVGTAFELAALDLLASPPHDMVLIRVGGAGDKGVDLRGRWHPSRRIGPLDVIVQCKAERAPVRPAVLRELEGVLQNEHSRHSTRSGSPLGILVSLNGFSRQTLERSLESQWPLSLVHLDVDRAQLRLDLPSRRPLVDLNDSSPRVVSWTRNLAWKRLVDPT